MNSNYILQLILQTYLISWSLDFDSVSNSFIWLSISCLSASVFDLDIPKKNKNSDLVITLK